MAAVLQLIDQARVKRDGRDIKIPRQLYGAAVQSCLLPAQLIHRAAQTIQPFRTGGSHIHGEFHTVGNHIAASRLGRYGAYGDGIAALLRREQVRHPADHAGGCQKGIVPHGHGRCPGVICPAGYRRGQQSKTGDRFHKADLRLRSIQHTALLNVRLNVADEVIPHRRGKEFDGIARRGGGLRQRNALIVRQLQLLSGEGSVNCPAAQIRGGGKTASLFLHKRADLHISFWGAKMLCQCARSADAQKNSHGSVVYPCVFHRVQMRADQNRARLLGSSLKKSVLIAHTVGAGRGEPLLGKPPAQDLLGSGVLLGVRGAPQTPGMGGTGG